MAKKIPLTQGKFAIVDDEDFELVRSLRWFASTTRNKTYAARNPTTSNKHRSMHRLVASAKQGEIVDHINGDTLDNRRSNLRKCSNAENIRNAGKPKNNVSGYKGVTFHKRKKKWQAQIQHENKNHYVGLFDSKEAAAKARDLIALELHGEFAYLNFPPKKD